MFNLTGKTALVTGAAQGIGLGIAQVFASAGAHVFLCDLQAEMGIAASKAINENSGKAEFVAADISIREQAEAFIKAAADQTGRIDILCNNASCTSGLQHDVAGATDEEWSNNIKVGLMGMQYCTAAALPYMISRKSGSIIIISSVQALSACQASAPYTTIKAGQLGFMKSAAFDYGTHNIRVNAICPGPIQVGYSPEPGSAHYDSQVSRTMLKRVGMPKEIGYAALFLASEEGSYVTGAVLPVDGGWSAM